MQKMADTLSTPPVLSTPEAHILNDTSDANAINHVERLSDEQLMVRYEISRTVDEIRQQKWRRVALQFPDEMLPHSAGVYQLLARGLTPKREQQHPRGSLLSTSRHTNLS